jgi:hypothetical protein
MKISLFLLFNFGILISGCSPEEGVKELPPVLTEEQATKLKTLPNLSFAKLSDPEKTQFLNIILDSSEGFDEIEYQNATCQLANSNKGKVLCLQEKAVCENIARDKKKKPRDNQENRKRLQSNEAYLRKFLSTWEISPIELSALYFAAGQHIELWKKTACGAPDQKDLEILQAQIEAKAPGRGRILKMAAMQFATFFGKNPA